ncbi:MAG: hypothetical protein RIC30_21420 [Marinoscillum sp.]|uniref:hypothetical protein n=1 Tax=Marinoscillum sp. TaxID=2024838 RepID=UPI00330392CB
MEEWKVWESDEIRNKFLVSSYGEVKSLYFDPPKLLKHYKNMGYRAIPTRKKDGKNTLIYVHKVVAELFVPNPKNHTHLIFIDENKGNPEADNLRWVDKATFKDHMSKYHKSAYTYDKDFTPNNKLTRTQVAVIKKMMGDPNRKTRVKIIAKQFGVSVGTIFSIKRGDSWKHVKAAGSDKSSS